MDRRRVHSGLFGSIGLHLVIMLIPLTTTVVREFDEIELLVVNEKPVIKEQISERPQMATVSKAVEQEVKKKPIISPMPPATEEESPLNQTVTEPEEQLIEEPPEETPATMESPVAVETPSILPEQIPEDPPKSQSTQLPQTIMPVVQNKGTETTQSTQVQSATHNGSAGSQTSSLTQPLSSSDDVPFGSEVAPRFLRREIPIYPLLARRLGKEGKVLLRLTIDERGNLLGVDVIEKGGYGFTEAALDAVRKSTFLPAKKDGKPIASRALLPIRFQLERKGW